MNSNILRGILALLLTSLLVNCSSDQAQNRDQLTKVKVVDILKKDVPIYQEFVGQVSGLFDIPIRARVDGFLEERYFQEGGAVKKGQLLYVIDSQSYLAEVANKKSEVAEAQSILVNAENELNRIEPLAKKNAVSQSDLDAAIAEKGAAEASLEAAYARLEIAKINLGYTEIRSPINGVIGQTKAKRGEYVGKVPNPVILNTVSRIDTILVQFFLTESEYLEIARHILLESDAIELDKDNRRNQDNLTFIFTDGTEHKYKGNVDFVDRNVDPTTGSMLVQASFPNPEKIIRPGQFSRVKIETSIEKDAMLIPLRCIVDIQGQSKVYIVKEDQSVEMREIESGGNYGDLVLVTSGLNHNEQVIIEGIQFVKTGMKVESEKVEFKSQTPNPF